MDTVAKSSDQKHEVQVVMRGKGDPVRLDLGFEF